MGTILSALVSGLLSWFSGLLQSWLGKQQDRAEGAEAQKVQDTQLTVAKESAMAQAEAQAPRTQAEVVNRLREGSF